MLRPPRPAFLIKRSSRAGVPAAIAALALVLAAPMAAPALGPAPPGSVASDGMDGDEPRVEGRLLFDLESTPARVGILFELDPDWHLYWRNPGETGLPTEIRWTVDDGEAGPIAWPAPERFRDLSTGLESYGYEGSVLLASTLAGVPTGRVRAEAELLVCHDKCIPALLTLSREVDPEVAPAERAAERAVFERFAALVPEPAAARGVSVETFFSRSAVRPGDVFEGAIVVSHADGLRPDTASFFPELDVSEALAIEVTDVSAHPHREEAILLALRGELDAEAESPLAGFGGVLALEDRNGVAHHLSFTEPFPQAPAGAASAELGAHWLRPPATGFALLELLRVLLLAMLGGLVLNGMPCVLPVLGIKVCSAAELAQEDRGELRRHGFAYLAGVLASMAVLAGVVIALQAAGTRVGWGFQFQEPLFVAVVTSVVVMFALNLFGVFEIQASAGRLSSLATRSHGATRSFFDGLLSVVLATPCTAPFLGTAVGFAFAGGAITIALIFLSIGVGLAAPYTLVCLVPGWARFVPRAGAWMLRLRASLGFLLLATAVWLLWIFGRSTDVDGVARLLALLVALSFGAWTLGWVQTLARPRAYWGTMAALFVVAVTGLNTVRVEASRAEPLQAEGAVAGWAPYDAEQIQAALAEDRPVFVSFTADWCITCKVNEAGVLSDERVRDAMAELGFAVFRGDWTQRDEAIRAELARHGRAGVPLYLVYDPARPATPTVLPEILRVEGTLTALAEAAAGPTQAFASARSDRP